MTEGFKDFAVHTNMRAGYGNHAEFGSALEFRQRYIIAGLTALIAKKLSI